MILSEGTYFIWNQATLLTIQLKIEGANEDVGFHFSYVRCMFLFARVLNTAKFCLLTELGVVRRPIQLS